MPTPATPDQNGCPICGRPNCPRWRRAEARTDCPIGYVQDCDARRIDWRALYFAHREQTTREIAAYLLDRADQYEDNSPSWVGLAEAARNVINGEAGLAAEHGELDADLLRRVDLLRDGKPARPVDRTAGSEE